MTQVELNNYIAEELNKWQPILEYARITLDDDKDLRNRYKWLLYVKKLFPWGIMLVIIEGLLSIFIHDLQALWIIFGVLFFSIIAFICVLYSQRNVLAKIMNKNERKTLSSLIDETSIYISKLGTWLGRTGPGNKVTNTELINLFADFSSEKAINEKRENQFSKIHGKNTPERTNLANEYANKRLQPLKQYTYDE